jgi:hypothetical protein
MQLNMSIHRNNMSRDEAKTTWKKLELAIEKIYLQNTFDLSFEELYRYGYKMVIHRHGELLYAGMEQSIRNHLCTVTKQLEGRTDVAFMKELLVKWQAFHNSTTKVQNILMVSRLSFAYCIILPLCQSNGMEGLQHLLSFGFLSWPCMCPVPG